MIEIEDLYFAYRAGESDAVPALQSLSLTIDGGEFLALVGRNGSGKSTLLRLLLALLSPTSGHITVDGIPVTEARRWDVRERVSAVFQDPDNQLVANRVVDDVAFGPENLGRPRAEIVSRVGEGLDAVGIDAWRERSIADLSAGEKQRVAIAGAVAMRPSFLVLDEPTSLLSPIDAHELIDALRRINRERGMGIIYITQSMDEAAQFDRVVVLHNGLLVDDGPPAHVFRHEDTLRRIGLDVPLPVRLAHRLQDAGIRLPGEPLTAAAFVDAVRVAFSPEPA